MMEFKHCQRIDLLCDLIVRQVGCNISLTIRTRGPYAFHGLLRSLRQSNQDFLAEISDMPY